MEIAFRRIWLVYNHASGSCSPDMLAAIKRALAGAGCTVERITDLAGPDLLPTPSDLDAAGTGLLAVLSGDGTANSVLTAVEGWHGAALVLPGGTANLLARELNGELSAEELAARVADLRRTRRNAVITEHGKALVEVLAGPGALWSEVRESLREADPLAVIGTAATALRETAAGAAVRIAAPEVGNAEGYQGLRMAPRKHGIAVEGFGAESLGDYLQQGLALLRRNFREGPHDDLGLHQELLCRSLEDDPIALMIDGELRHGNPSERVRLAEFELDLLTLAA